jgi:hypothetical protein
MRAAIIGLALLASAASTASAQTISGTFDPGQSGPYLDLFLPFSGGPGVYQVSLDLSQPGSGLLELGYTSAFDWFGVTTGQYYGGDDEPILADTFFDQTRHVASSISVPRNHTFVFDGGGFGVPERIREYDTFYNAHAWLDVGFDDVTPVNYTLTATRIADVPEPATWALLLVGFGLCGALLRKRQQVVLAASAQATAPAPSGSPPGRRPRRARP